MSSNHNTPGGEDSNHETADSIIRGILDDNRSREEISPSGELYRFMEGYRRARGAAARRNQQLPSLRDMAAENDSSRQNSLPGFNAVSTAASPLHVMPPQPNNSAGDIPSQSSPTVAARLAQYATRRVEQSRRPRMTPSDRYLERQRHVAERELRETANRPMANLEARYLDARREVEATERELEAATSNLRARLDAPLPSVLPPFPRMSLSPMHFSSTIDDRQAKRRKMDTDTLEKGFSGFSYGKYGQVEQGKLVMEIVSCDGGTFEGEPPSRRKDFEPENVLIDDHSVYCTKSNRCNLVLRHQGSTTFCLTELVIKAPHQNFTAPIQEGLVFVSMTSDDLLTRTAKYQIQYSAAKPRRPAAQRSHHELPPIISIRHNVDGSMSQAQARARRLYDIGMQDEDCDSRTAQMPSDFTSTAPGFSNTTECSDSEDEGRSGLSRHQRSVEAFMGRQGIRFEDSDTDHSDCEDDREYIRPRRDEHTGVVQSPRLHRRETASNITLAEAVEASQIATQEAVAAVGGELMVPHAKFFIERHKSKTTIKFDPPVSGRFILLKLWSPHPSPTENIDIQTVICKGFAGPRFFPAITMMR